MSRTTPEFQSQAEKHELSPLALVRILNIQDPAGIFTPVYLTDWPEDVMFFDEDGNEQIYLSCGVSFSQISVTNDTEIDGGSLKIDNTNLNMGKLALTHNLKNARIQIIRAIYEHLDDPLYSMMIFQGYLRQYRVSEHDIEFTLVSVFNLMQKGPKRLHWNYCPWGFKGPECAYAGSDETCEHTIADCVAKENEANFGGFPYLPAGKDIRDPL